MLEDTLARPWEYRCITARFTELGIKQPCPPRNEPPWKPFQHPARDWKPIKPCAVVWEFPERPLPSPDSVLWAAVLNAAVDHDRKGIRRYSLWQPHPKFSDDFLAVLYKGRSQSEGALCPICGAALVEYYDHAEQERASCPWVWPATRLPWPVQSGSIRRSGKPFGRQ